MSAAMTPSVASAVRWASTDPVSDASGSRRGTTEASVMDSIISTVPPRVGVMMRRRTNSHLEMISWAIAQTTTKAVSVDGPPSTTAEMQKGMEKAAVNMGSTAPAPTGPTRLTCTSVETPATRREAKTIQTR